MTYVNFIRRSSCSWTVSPNKARKRKANDVCTFVFETKLRIRRLQYAKHCLLTCHDACRFKWYLHYHDI